MWLLVGNGPSDVTRNNKINKLDSSTLKNKCVPNDTIEEEKRSTQSMGEVVAKHITHKGLGAKTNKRICKEMLK